MLVVRLSCGCHRRVRLQFLLLTKVLRGSWRVMTRSFNIALNFGNGAAVREFKLRSRTHEQAVFGRHLCGCVCAAPGTCEVALQQCMWSKIVSTSDKLAPSPKLATSHMHTNIGRRRTSRGLYAARVVATQSDCAKRSQRVFVDKKVDKVHFALSHYQMTFLRLSASSIAQCQSDWCQSSRRCYTCLVVFPKGLSPRMRVHSPSSTRSNAKL